MALLIPEKRDFELKIIIRDKEGDYLLIRGSTHKEDITIMDIHTADNRTSKHEAKMDRTEWRNSSTLIAADINTSLSI